MSAVRFVLLSTARSGSNLLSSLLGSNPAVRMYGELFNLDGLPRDRVDGALENPIRYLRECFRSGRRLGASAVGFKMFYDHLTRDYFRKLVDTSGATERVRRRAAELLRHVDEEYDWVQLDRRFRDAWLALERDRKLAVVHLKRRNMLHTLVSLKSAFDTGQFWVLGDPQRIERTVRITPAECERYFRHVRGAIAKADRRFRAHPKVDVFYEALVADMPAEVDRLCRFLGVEGGAATTRMKRQRLRPVSQVVENYAELKEWAAGSEWEAHFDEAV